MQIDDDSTVADLRRYDLLVFGGWNTMTPHVKDVLERYVKGGGTLVLSRPELTTRVDRDFVNYADSDLLAPFGFLPPEGKTGEFAERSFGKGRYFLFTNRKFPAETKEGREAYESLVRRLAAEVKQTVRLLGKDDAPPPDCITYAVYGTKMYFLNMDTRRERKFAYEIEGKRSEMTLAPCEIKVVDRRK